MEESVNKKTKLKKALLLAIGIVIILITSFFVVTGAIYLYGNPSSAEGSNTIVNPMSDDARRYAVVNNDTSEESMYYDRFGNIVSRGNLTFNTTGSGYGYFNWLGKSANKITNGFFSFLHADYINSTQLNASTEVYINSSSVSKWLYNTTQGAMTYGNTTWIPYNGAIGNVNLSNNNITAGFGSKFGSELRYITFKNLDFDGNSYTIMKAVTDGNQGNITAFANTLMISNVGSEIVRGSNLSKLMFYDDVNKSTAEMYYNPVTNYLGVSKNFYSEKNFTVAPGGDYCITGGVCLSTLSYVPYTGATQNININSRNLTTTGVGYLGFLSVNNKDKIMGNENVGVTMINNGTFISNKDIHSGNYILDGGAGTSVVINNLFSTHVLEPSGSGFTDQVIGNAFGLDTTDSGGVVSPDMILFGNQFSAGSTDANDDIYGAVSTFISSGTTGKTNLTSAIIIQDSGVEGTTDTSVGLIISDWSKEFATSEYGGTITYNGINLYSLGATSRNVFEGNMQIGNTYGGFGNILETPINNNSMTLDVYGSGINVSEGEIYVNDNFFNYGNSYLVGDVGIGTYNPTHKLNVVGSANITGNLMVQGNITGNNYYGSMYNFSDSGWAIGLATSGVYYNLTVSTAGELNGFKIIQGGALGTKLQPQIGGYYSIDGVLTGDFAGGEYGVGLVTNGANPEVVGRCYTRTNLNGQAPIAITCMKRLSSGDNITMVIDDESTPTKDVTVHNINIKALRIGN